MKLTLQHHRLRSTDELDSLVEERILALQPRLQIDEANVRLECRHEDSPAFSVRIHLVTPGPDVIAEGRDHTILAAVNKVMAALQEKIGSRALKRARRGATVFRRRTPCSY
jgi:ribosome-associated translation inhibitor RaiA